MAWGPCTGDLAGLDVGWRIRKGISPPGVPGIRQPLPKIAFVNSAVGQKTGAGWYTYDDQRLRRRDPS